MSELKQELVELHDYFSSVDLPTGDLKINRYLTVNDVPYFIDAEIKRIQKYSVNESAWDREFKHLRDLKAALEARNS